MTSSRSRGTLSQLKAEFNRRNVSTDINTSFNHVWDFLQVRLGFVAVSLSVSSGSGTSVVGLGATRRVVTAVTGPNKGASTSWSTQSVL